MAKIIKFSLLIMCISLITSCSNDDISTIEGPDETATESSEAELMDYHFEIDGEKYYPIDTVNNVFLFMLPERIDVSNIVALYKTNAQFVFVDSIAQVAGRSVNDFSDLKDGIVYTITSKRGGQKEIVIKVLNTKLPVVSISTDSCKEILDKENWIEGNIKIQDVDGTTEVIGGTGIKGRGNYTWTYYPKKPYALKLDKKYPVLGMPKHKRWILLACYRGFIGNPMMFEASRRATAIGWVPRGQFVELFLNGNFQGLYYLCEHVKIDENRVNITKIGKSDLSYPEVSGGYLLEYDRKYDEEYKFRSSLYDMPVMFKEPDEKIPQAQIDYVQSFIKDLETELIKLDNKEDSNFHKYLDIENWTDFWLALELIGNYEACKPRSVKLYKGRDGVDSPIGTISKLKIGPLWDQELFLVDQAFNTKDSWYYKSLFNDSAFVATVKERWSLYKDDILGNNSNISFLDYLDGLVKHIEKSANRDTEFWNNEYFTLDKEVEIVKSGFLNKLFWMDQQIIDL